MHSSLELQQNLCKNSLVTPTQSLHVTSHNPSPWDGDFGVDTVKIGFPINPELLSLHEPVWIARATLDPKYDKEFENFEHNVWIGHSNVNVRVLPSYGKASLEFNSAQIRRPKSLFLLEPNELVDVVEEVLDGVSHLVSGIFDRINPNTGEIVRDPNWLSIVSFIRLDLAKNLYIPSRSDLVQVKAAIEKATPTHMRKKEKHESREEGWTVYNKTSSSGLERIYDKHVEAKVHRGFESVAPGTLRFETQLKGKRLTAPTYIKKLDQLTNDNAWEALENRWKACKWAVPIMEANSIYDAVSGLSHAKQQSILGYMMMAADGYPIPLDQRHINTKNKEARALGLVPGMPISSQGSVSKILDLKAGGLINIC
jgi:hypothetical protein